MQQNQTDPNRTQPSRANPIAMESDPVEGVPVGRNPRDLTVSELRAIGHEPQPVAKAVREKCLDCCGDNRAEVRRCTAVACALWPFRMGVNPFYGHRQEAAETPQTEGV